jgi:carboxymethylenebutenolidase
VYRAPRSLTTAREIPMTTTHETIDIQTSDGPMAAHVYRPTDDAQHAAVIMIHGAPGIDVGVHRMADDLAGEGFVVIAPDLLHRSGRLQVMAPDWSMERRNAMQDGLTEAAIIRDVDDVITALHAMPSVQDGPAGITGFCLGGRVSYLATVHNEGIGAAVMYYPTGLVLPDKRTPGSRTPVAMVGEIKAPIIGFLPTLDLRHASPEIIAEVSAAFASANVDGEIIPVEGANHGFIDPLGHVYDPVEGPKSWARMIAFFRANL